MQPDTPLLVTEHGIATADDADRVRFTEDGLAASPKPSLAWLGEVARRDGLAQRPRI